MEPYETKFRNEKISNYLSDPEPGQQHKVCCDWLSGKGARSSTGISLIIFPQKPEVGSKDTLTTLWWLIGYTGMH